MDDFEKLINASDLIEWIMKTYPDWCVGDVRSIVDHVMDMPSAQPEPSTERQEILEYLDTVLHPIISPEHWDVYSELHDMISSLPTEQPEPLTDKEQRIFLAAMAREEKVCRQVDDECRDRTPYEVSLVHVCKEIRRKVKGALWA